MRVTCNILHPLAHRCSWCPVRALLLQQQWHHATDKWLLHCGHPWLETSRYYWMQHLWPYDLLGGPEPTCCHPSSPPRQRLLFEDGESLCVWGEQTTVWFVHWWHNFLYLFCQNMYDSMRPSVLWNIQAQAQGWSPEGQLPVYYCKTTHAIMCFISQQPLTKSCLEAMRPCNNNTKVTVTYCMTFFTPTTGYLIINTMYCIPPSDTG